MTIWKFPLYVTDLQRISMPGGAKILAVQVQKSNQQPCLWAVVDPDATAEVRTIRIFGTGHPLGGVDGDGYIGTFQQLGGSLVWHVFEAAGSEGEKP